MNLLDSTGSEYIAGIFEREVLTIEEKLRNANSKEETAVLISQIGSLEFAQKLLRRCFEHRISASAVWRKIPMPQHQFSEYRLLEDFDMDNQKCWKELSDIRPSGGDILIGQA